jgi:hypothetical protein
MCIRSGAVFLIDMSTDSTANKTDKCYGDGYPDFEKYLENKAPGWTPIR